MDIMVVLTFQYIIFHLETTIHIGIHTYIRERRRPGDKDREMIGALVLSASKLSNPWIIVVSST